MYGPFPDLEKGVRFFVSLLPPGDWFRRREAVAKRFYQSLIGELDQMDDRGKFFDTRDVFGWLLFLGESFTDHPWNYEVMYGCRVIPIFAAIGRNLDILHTIEGFTERARTVAMAERSQPNGGLFEILVAAAYARAGWRVRFNPVRRGVARTHDLDVWRRRECFAVECKRMEGGEYVEAERARMRELWKIPCLGLTMHEKRSTYLEVRFKVELFEVPDRYLLERVYEFVHSNTTSLLWNDNISSGVIGDLDLTPVRESLKIGYLLHPGPVFNKLLTGSYRRYDSLIEMSKVKHAVCPHFIDEIDLAVVARWSSQSEAAIDKKARDIQAKLVEANKQLPSDVPGVIHIGFEALSGDIVEERRYQKILARAREFDRAGSRLEFIYCHYFAPETTPDETWAIDETFQWIGTDWRQNKRPLRDLMLLLPEDEGLGRTGVHWDGGGSMHPTVRLGRS